MLYFSLNQKYFDDFWQTIVLAMTRTEKKNSIVKLTLMFIHTALGKRRGKVTNFHNFLHDWKPP